VSITSYIFVMFFSFSFTMCKQRNWLQTSLNQTDPTEDTGLESNEFTLKALTSAEPGTPWASLLEDVLRLSSEQDHTWNREKLKEAANSQPENLILKVFTEIDEVTAKSKIMGFALIQKNVRPGSSDVERVDVVHDIAIAHDISTARYQKVAETMKQSLEPKVTYFVQKRDFYLDKIEVLDSLGFNRPQEFAGQKNNNSSLGEYKEPYFEAEDIRLIGYIGSEIDQKELLKDVRNNIVLGESDMVEASLKNVLNAKAHVFKSFPLLNRKYLRNPDHVAHAFEVEESLLPILKANVQAKRGNQKTSLAILAPPGIGKSTNVGAFIAKYATNKYPELNSHPTLFFQGSLTEINAGTQIRGSEADKAGYIMEYAQYLAAKGISLVLVSDEFHNVYLDKEGYKFMQAIKTPLSEDTLRMWGMTTPTDKGMSEEERNNNDKAGWDRFRFVEYEVSEKSRRNTVIYHLGRNELTKDLTKNDLDQISNEILYATRTLYPDDEGYRALVAFIEKMEPLVRQGKMKLPLSIQKIRDAIKSEEIRNTTIVLGGESISNEEVQTRLKASLENRYISNASDIEKALMSVFRYNTAYPRHLSSQFLYKVGPFQAGGATVTQIMAEVMGRTIVEVDLNKYADLAEIMTMIKTKAAPPAFAIFDVKNAASHPTLAREFMDAMSKGVYDGGTWKGSGYSRERIPGTISLSRHMAHIHFESDADKNGFFSSNPTLLRGGIDLVLTDADSYFWDKASRFYDQFLKQNPNHFESDDMQKRAKIEFLESLRKNSLDELFKSGMPAEQIEQAFRDAILHATDACAIILKHTNGGS
jgi:hypothetical protein